MDQLTRRRIAFAIILILMVAGSVFYFLWGAFLNRGTIVLIGEVPFEVRVYEEGNYLCETSPCEITQKIGLKNLILSKEGREDMIVEIDVPLWREIAEEVRFRFIPYLKVVEEIPDKDNVQEFTLGYDEVNKYYKLAEANSFIDEPIAFFAKEIKEPKMFGNDRTVLVIDGESNDAYKVDRSTNTKIKITEDLSGISKGEWSENGDFFVFETTDSPNIFIIGSNNETRQLGLTKEATEYTWADENSLFFVSNHGLASSSEVGAHLNYVTVVDDITTDFSFGIYHAEENSYTKIKSFDLEDSPTELIPASNGKI
ncbi:hypothetical protein HN709_03200, partial [Candidatus Peregrinibacteria bacterium]|nr:hypothetical protein [Candidatus Peregrinibacteria bacterium]